MEQCASADKELVKYLYELSHEYPNGIEELSVISGTLYEFLVTKRGYSQDDFKKSRDKVVTEGGEELTIYAEDPDLGRVRDDLYYQPMYDYDMMDYRKVISVRDYVEGSSTTMTSLFSFESALAS